MTNLWQRRFTAVILLILGMVLCNGCAGEQTSRQTSQQAVSPLYMLTTAGFKPWPVSDVTPKRQALLDAIPRGKISTYESGGAIYHAYADVNSDTLYIGDDAAYKRYLSMTKGRQLCERVEGKNQQQFWSCFEEFQATGGKAPE